MNCCSDRAITFHGMLPSKLYLMEYILNHLTVFKNSLLGTGNKPPANEKKSVQTVLKSDKMKRVGEPFVQLMDHNWIRTRKRKKMRKMQEDKNIWNEIFGS